MPIVFFEGFNSFNSDTIKLDPSYWSTDDQSKITFAGGRTDTQVEIANRPINSGLNYNTTLTMSNFVDPLVSHSGFGLGFYSNGNTLRTNTNAPYSENLVSFFDNSGEALRIDIVKTTYNSVSSMGLGIYQNNNLIETYDLKSPVGHSWTIATGGGIAYLSEESYLEIYISSLNNIAIRMSAQNSYETLLLNSLNNIYTSINGFSNLSGITFYSNNNFFGSVYQRSIDDLYLTAGNSVSECLLGYNTKIYRLSPDSNSSTQQWSANDGGSETSPDYYYLNSNNGDTDYIYSSTSGNASLYGMSNADQSSPTEVGGIKVINVVKNSDINEGISFINVMTSGGGGQITEIGNPKLVDSTSYHYKNSFFFNNPITSDEWTKTEINNMQLGVKII